MKVKVSNHDGKFRIKKISVEDANNLAIGTQLVAFENGTYLLGTVGIENGYKRLSIKLPYLK